VTIVEGCGGQPGTSCVGQTTKLDLFLGGIGLVGVAVLASLMSVAPDPITTVAAIVGGIIYGIVTGMFIVLKREPDE
jgi:Na+-translocating ferredoxin:NAD+ oxidoreductase RnfD subunit